MTLSGKVDDWDQVKYSIEKESTEKKQMWVKIMEIVVF